MEYLEHVEPIRCKCGFSHILGDTIQCTNPACSFWQHVVCYYGADDFTVAPENHMCDQCRSADPQQPREKLEEDHEMFQSAEDALVSGPHAERPQAYVHHLEGRSNIGSIVEDPFSFIDPHVERPLDPNPDTEELSTINPSIDEEPPEAASDVQEPNNHGPYFQEPRSFAHVQELGSPEPRSEESLISRTSAGFDAPVQRTKPHDAQTPVIAPQPSTYDTLKESLATFERQCTAANIQWGPDSNEVQSCLKKISLQCFNISKSLLRDGFLLAEVPMVDHLIQQMHISSCFAYSPNSNSRPPSSRVTERWLRVMLVACAVDWIFYPGQSKTVQATRDELSSVSRLDVELNLILAHSFHTELATRCK